MYVVVLALYVLVAGWQMSVSHSVMSSFLQVRHQKEYLLKDEFEKFFIKGNQSAGIRIRKIMQEIRIKSKVIRETIQEHKNQFEN